MRYAVRNGSKIQELGVEIFEKFIDEYIISVMVFGLRR